MAEGPRSGEIARMPHHREPGRDDRSSALGVELRSVTALAVPVVLVQLGLMSMGVVDSIMVGHVSARVLASVALGNIYFFNVIVLSMGTLMALDPIVAQAVGAHDEVGVARGIQRGFLIAGLLACSRPC
jgi:MATE family multidrug resistance protein